LNDFTFQNSAIFDDVYNLNKEIIFHLTEQSKLTNQEFNPHTTNAVKEIIGVSDSYRQGKPNRSCHMCECDWNINFKIVFQPPKKKKLWIQHRRAQFGLDIHMSRFRPIYLQNGMVIIFTSLSLVYMILSC